MFTLTYYAALLLSLVGTFNAFVPRSLISRRMQYSMSTESDAAVKINPREERRRILGSENYNRMGFKEEKAEVKDMMVQEFASPLIAEIRANKGTIQRGDLTIKLAEFYGFCWGVERA
eukprot:gene45429-60693_t